MKLAILLLICTCSSMIGYSQSKNNEKSNIQKVEPINVHDEIIDTVTVDKKKYINFYRPRGSFPINLDFDDFIDTIKWEDRMFQFLETGEANFDMGQRIRIINKHGEFVCMGDWEYIQENLRQFNDLSYKHNDKSILFVRLDQKTTGIVLPHQIYASDPDAYTIIKIDSLSKSHVIFDSAFYLTSFEDIDKDGFYEFIGKLDYYGEVRDPELFVPYKVYTYKNLGEKLTVLIMPSIQLK